jgi:hypothetical protein
MPKARLPFNEALHPRGFGGKFGHGTGTKKAPVGKTGRAATRKYSAKDVTSGGPMKKASPVAAQKPGFWKFGPADPNEGPKAKARRAAAKKVAAAAAPKKKAVAPEKKAPAAPAPATPKPKPKPKPVAESTPTPTPKKRAAPKKRSPKLRKGEIVTTGAENNVAEDELPEYVIRRSTADDGKRVRIINDVAAMSNPADFKKEENSSLTPEQQQEALAHAKVIFKEGVTKAPDIRAAIRDVVAENGGHMGREFDEKTGEPTAVKTAHSIFRKVQDKVAKGKADRAAKVALADAVRFTSVFEEDNYVESVEALRATLEGMGYKQTEPPPSANGVAWALGPYRGLNMNFQDESGFTFEVQAHTVKSLETADHDAHKLYEIFRKDGKDFEDLMKDPGPKGAHQMTGINPEGLTPAHYRELINTKMHDVAETIPIPKGVTVISGKDQWDKIVLVTEKTGNYSARDASELRRKKPKPRALASDDLDMKQLTDTVAQHFENPPADDSAFQAVGKAWYPAAMAQVNAWVEGTDFTPEQGVAIMAAFSPNTPWNRNCDLARNYIQGLPLGKEEGDAGTLTDNVKRADRVRDMVDFKGNPIPKNKDGSLGNPIEALPGNDPYGTMKIVSFHRNITGDEHAVTVDRHAMRAAMKRMPTEEIKPGDTPAIKAAKEKAFGDRAGRVLNQKGTYAKVAKAYRDAAAKYGVTPAQMQAIVWGEIRGGYG